MTKIVLVSLVHNRKGLVGLALQSATNQTLPKNKWTHLVIDNASTDGADKVCETFASKYSHIRFVKMGNNIGQMPAYNYALNDWLPKNFPDADVMVQFDSDDMLESIALEKVYEYFYKYKNIGMTYSNFTIIGDAPRNKIKYYSHPKAKEAPNQLTPDGQKILRQMQISGNVIGHLRAMKIECLKNIGGFDEKYKYSTDYNMACKMIEKYPVIKINGVPLYLWREHGTQVQAQYSPEQTQNWKDLQQHYREKWKKEGLI